MRTMSEKVDPIMVAVLNSRFESIADEMGTTLLRASRSTVFAEAGDFATGIFDKNTRLLAQKEFQPVLAGANVISLQHIAAAYEGNINEGDVFIHNDSYDGNTHLGDLNIAKPGFYRGKLAFWTIIKGHMSDTGNKGVAGTDPTSTTIWQDGVVVPPIKLYEIGQLNDGVKALYLRNLKVPDIVWGDILCMIGGCTVGERMLVDLLDRYGLETVYMAIEEILKVSENEMRDLIRQIPDGVYYGEKSTDHDAINRDKPVTTRVKVTIEGDELSIDLTGSDPTVAGYINSTWAVTYSICHMVISFSFPSLVKRNHGPLVPIKIIAPSGTWTNPTFPASVAKATSIAADCIGEAILIALSQAIPSEISAPHGKMSHLLTHGFHPRTNRRWVDIDFFMSDEPSGGTEGYDGWDSGGPLFNLGAMRVPDIEIIEMVKPVHILQYELQPDTAGAGRFRSGFGHIYRYESLSDEYPGGSLTGAGMRDFSVPAGLFGGKSPKPTSMVVHHAGDGVENFDVGTFCQLNAGDIVQQESMGGGGFGNAWERDVERVREDVLDELVTLEGARQDYGVVINPVTLIIDYKETEQLRNSYSKE